MAPSPYTTEPSLTFADPGVRFTCYGLLGVLLWLLSTL